MEWLKILVIGLAGMGVTWAAQQAADRSATVVLAQAPDGTAAAADAGADADLPEESESMTEAELEAELERIEQAVDDTDELEEFTPTKPLAADLGVALPSDI